MDGLKYCHNWLSKDLLFHRLDYSLHSVGLLGSSVSLRSDFTFMQSNKETRVTPAKTEEAEMSFLDHLEELRWHIIRSVVAILLVAIVAYIFEDWVFRNIIFAPVNSDFITYRLMCSLSDTMCFDPPDFEIIPREMGEQFFTSLKVSFWLGLAVAFPYVFYQIWTFVRPGLYDNERKSARGIVFICSILFSIGVAFGYFIMSPFAINFLAGYSVGMEVNNSTSLASYVNSLVMFALPTGVVFELPVFVYLLSSLGVLGPEVMRKYRKHAMVIILILAAIITPPDVVTQIMIGIPVFALYEVSIYVSKYVEKKRLKKLASL